jgi:hypothetical protein
MLLLGLGSQAGAASFAWCQMSGSDYRSYLSGIVEIGDGAEAYKAFVVAPFGKDFSDYVRNSVDPGASNLRCSREESLFYANDHIDVLIASNPGIKFVKTGWSGARHATKETPQRSGGQP